MNIYPQFFSNKSIPVEKATVEELNSCKKNCKIYLAVWSICLCFYVFPLTTYSPLTFTWFVLVGWCAMAIFQLWYRYKMLKTTQKGLKLAENKF